MIHCLTSRPLEIIAALGVNTPQHLERATKPAVTFDSIADAWEAKLLPSLYNSSQSIIPKRLRKHVQHVRPFFGQMAVATTRILSISKSEKWQSDCCIVLKTDSCTHCRTELSRCKIKKL